MLLAWDTSLERQLADLDREIADHHRSLERLTTVPAVDAEHACRRARLAQVMRDNLDWLEPRRTALRAAVSRSGSRDDA